MCPTLSDRTLIAIDNPKQYQRRELRLVIATEIHRELAHHNAFPTGLHLCVQTRIRRRLRRQSRDLRQRVDDVIETIANAIPGRDLRALIVPSDNTLEDGIFGRGDKDIVQRGHNRPPRSGEHLGVIYVGVADDQVPRCLSLDEQLLPRVLKGVFVVVFLRQHNLIVFDRIVDLLEVLRIEVFARVHPTQVLSKCFLRHPAYGLDVRVVEFGV